MISAETFDLAMRKLGVVEAAPRIAVAVSGGGDSMALVMLMQEWVKARSGTLLALTVDHQLRAESADEAAQVHEDLTGRGIAHEILRWEGDKPASHIQELAREARYNLLLKACQERGFPMLAVAHNLEDQIETFWMRLAHGSGLDGLAGMAGLRVVEGISIIRPLLSFARDDLRSICTEYNMRWIEDPSNQNQKFLRVKLRQFEGMLAEEGLTAARLGTTLQKLEDTRAALEVMRDQAIAACVMAYPEGYLRLSVNAWRDYPRDIQRRVLSHVLSMIAPQKYPIGFEQLEQMRQDLCGENFNGKNLAGCEIVPAQNGDVLIIREAAVVAPRIKIYDGLVWDGRFRVAVSHQTDLEIGALGDAGLAALKSFPEAVAKLQQLPFKIRRVLPALWQGDRLCAVPHIGYELENCSVTLLNTY